MKRNKEIIYGTKLLSGTKLLFPALLLPGLLLAGCGTNGAGAQGSPQANTPAADAQAPQSDTPTADAPTTDVQTPEADVPTSDAQTPESDAPGADGQTVKPAKPETSSGEKEAETEQQAGNNDGGGKADAADSSKDADDSSKDAGDSNKDAEAADPVMAARAASSLQTTIKKAGGVAVVTNATAQTVIVNKQRSLPKGYEPSDLVVPNVPFSFDGPHEKRHMRKEAAGALEKLFAAAKKDGIKLRAVSGYRSYARQKTIYNNNVKTKGLEYASKVSAVPGMSEHQTGLAIDVSSPSVGNALEQSFGSSKEGKWLAKHAPEYGFVIRYPKGKDDITGYVYEPWHIRYIGVDLAEDAATKGLTLEEYFDEDHIKL
ncbi:D-alanyl-D-alanine carboxypeptidase family protein [Paenibacillus jiagnxiensis]|uniref:D-alanyl-D-alanine carboxypeptidase family protein n=1 Tax=Paenibacillus jiagnxiensis TaxID=3228926 RepID=UPI0033B1B94A